MPNFKDYQQAIAPPWIAGGVKGRAWPRGQGDVKDQFEDLFRESVRQRFPLYASEGALAAIGAERGIQRGPGESATTYAERLRQAWSSWPWAGTPFGLLSAMYASGFKPLLMVPGGYAYRLNNPGYLDNLEQIPLSAGSWSHEAVPTFWNRFHVLFDAPPNANWNRTQDANFVILSSGSGVAFMKASADPVGGPARIGTLPQLPLKMLVRVIASGSLANGSGASFQLSTDGGISWGPTTFGNSTTSIAFTRGASYLLPDLTTAGYVAGAVYAPFAVAGSEIQGSLVAPAAELELLRALIAKWKPGTATCSGISLICNGRAFGWPLRTLGALDGRVLGGSTVVTVPGE